MPAPRVRRFLVAYSGRSLLSRAIRWFTWHHYNHIAWVRADWSLVDCWKRGVRLIDYPWFGHHPDTRIWLHEIHGTRPIAAEYIDDFFAAQVGKRYSFRGLFRFLLRRDPKRFRGGTAHTIPPEKISRWFCSNIGAYAHERYDAPLADLPFWRVSPQALAASPRTGPPRQLVPGSVWPPPDLATFALD